MNMYVRHSENRRGGPGCATLARCLTPRAFQSAGTGTPGDCLAAERRCTRKLVVRLRTVRLDLSLELEPSFLEHLQSTLAALHTAQREPVDQSLRGGTQTAGVLFGRREPVIRALRDACASAITRYVSALLDDEQHPLLRRKSLRTHFAGSWSVRLRSSGRHANHFHQEGWISSAFYVQLPPTMLDEEDGRADGWIQFGARPRNWA